MITSIDLPEEIINEAEGAAVARGTTFQALVVEGLKSVLHISTTPAPVSQQALVRLRTGLHLGGGAYLTRDEAHAR